MSWLGRFNAWFFDALTGYQHRKYGALKTRLFGELLGTIVEIGAGSGTNLRYYAPGTRVLAVEPSRPMHARLQAHAQRLGVDLSVVPIGAERLDLPDNSVDAVVSTLVLCTVSDPAAVLAEAHRVLRPGGQLICIEHTLAPPSLLRWLQRLIRRPWRWLFEGCDLCRDLETVLRSTHFARLDIEPLTLPTIFFPIRHQRVARLTK